VDLPQQLQSHLARSALREGGHQLLCDLRGAAVLHAAVGDPRRRAAVPQCVTEREEVIFRQIAQRAHQRAFDGRGNHFESALRGARHRLGLQAGKSSAFKKRKEIAAFKGCRKYYDWAVR